jgi:hypothetical protein
MATGILPPAEALLDYEFVIRAFGGCRLRRPKFIPWSAQTGPQPTTRNESRNPS